MFYPQVRKYVEDSRAEHISDQEIKSNLLKSGWNESVINEIMLRAPKRINNYGMWIAFQYVLLFITLYVSATSLGGILYQMIDKYLPNPLEKSNYSYIFKS